jgi:DNA-binding NtrC family response regulator
MGDEFVKAGELGRNLTPHSNDAELFQLIREKPHATNGNGNERQPSLKNLVRTVKGEAERSAIARMLEKTQWNRKEAARELGISYRGLLYKIQEYHLIPSALVVQSTPNKAGGRGNGQE